MANIDISASMKQDRFNQSFQGAIQDRTYTWEPTKVVGPNGNTDEQGTHKLVPVPEGEAFLDGYAVVTEAFTSGGAATVQFKTGSGNFTGTLAVAILTVGTVIPLYPVASITATDGVAHYVDGTTITEETVDATIATADLTAGKAKLCLRFLKVADLQIG